MEPIIVAVAGKVPDGYQQDVRAWGYAREAACVIAKCPRDRQQLCPLGNRGGGTKIDRLIKDGCNA